MTTKALTQKKNQNFWQLACILGSALGLPAMIIGANLANIYGAGTAIIAICIGNIVLWMFGLSVISMAEGKANAVENVKVYLGKMTSVVAALVLVLAFLSWYAIQIKGASLIIGNLVGFDKHWKLGIFLGFFVAFLSMGGIRLIKKFCVIALPLLFLFSFYLILSSKLSALPIFNWGFSFSAILSIILIWLPGIINLPTFFQYSRSKSDSVLALSVMTIFHIFFQMFPILAGIEDTKMFLANHLINSSVLLYVVIGFVLLSYLCINLVNIYFASAGWELILPSHKGVKEYVIIGSLGTFFYVFLENYANLHQLRFPVLFLETITASFIISLGVVLLLDFLAKVVMKRKPQPQDQFWSSMCWLTGCIVAIIVHGKSRVGSNDSLIAASGASIIAFLCVVFIKETIWSVKSIRK